MSIDFQELRSFCVDEQAFSAIQKVLMRLSEEKKIAESNLHLLELAIKGDYDSILITELDIEFPGPKIVYVNDGFSRMTGYSREEVIGKTPRILQGKKTDRATLERLKKSLHEGKSFFGQAVNYRKDGTEFINQWDIHPIYDESGVLTHWVSYQHDITARKKAELAFLEQDVEFDDLYENSKRTLIDLNRRGEVLMANKAFRELLGYHQDEMAGKTLVDFVPKRLKRYMGSRYDLMWEEASSKELKYRTVLEHKTGQLIQIEMEAKMLNLSNEVVMRLSLKNVSLQKKVMRTLTKRNRQFDSVFAHFQNH